MPALATEKTNIDFIYRDNDAKTAMVSNPVMDSSAREDLIDNSQYLKRMFYESVRHKVKTSLTPRALVQLGDIHYAEQRYGKAKEVYLNALAIIPDTPEIVMKVIVIDLKAKRYGDANKFFLRLIKASDENQKYINDYLNMRLGYFVSGTSEAAETDNIMCHYVSKYPDNADYHNIYGLFLLLVDEKIYEAKKQFDMTLKIAPNHLHATNNIGVYYQRLNDYKNSEKYFKKAKEIDPKFVYAYQNLASNYYRQNDMNKALDILEFAYDSGIILDPLWKGNLSQLLSDISLNYDKSRAILAGLAENDPLNPGIFNNLGVSYERQQNFKKALEYFDDAYNLLINHHRQTRSWNEFAPMIFKNLAQLNYDIGNTRRAERIADEMMKYFPGFFYGFTLKARCFMNKHKIDEARPLLDRALRIGPSDPEAAVNLSYIYSVFDLDYGKSLSVLENYLDSDIKSMLGQLVRNNYTYALIKTDRTDEAKKYATQLVEIPDSLITNGLLNLYEDNYNKSITLYKKAFNILKNNPDTYIYNMNRLFYFYELAKYWFEHSDIKKTNHYLKEASRFDINSAISKQILELAQKVASR